VNRKYRFAMVLIGALLGAFTETLLGFWPALLLVLMFLLLAQLIWYSLFREGA